MKLVRDLIPHIIRESGKTCDYHIADGDEFIAELYKKMTEELNEFIEDPSVEEAADMYEVLSAICWYHNIQLQSVIKKAAEKKAARGGFTEGIILDGVNESR